VPITNETILEANRRMLGKTNRTILFAKVNLDEYLDPEAMERDREYTPSLGSLLSRVEETSEEQFLALVRESLTVTSFTEFLDKFQPGFYYRVRGPQMAQAEAVDAPLPTEEAPGPPQIEFSLEGGPGWKKIRISADHPYVRCLRDLIRKRVRQDVSTFRVDVDASLFAFKPKNQRTLMRKIAEDVQVKNDRLMLEVKRNPASKDTVRALEAYQVAADDFQGALEDTVRVLPTVVYGLEQTANELKRQSPGGGPIDPNVYQIEFGKNRSLIASPQSLPTHPALEAPEADGKKGKKVLEGDKKLLEGKSAAGNGEDGNALVKSDGGGSAGTAIVVRTLDTALDKIREQGKLVAGQDLALVPQEKRFPIAVGKFMDKMIDRGMIAPLMGNLVATVLQNPKELALLNPDIRDVEHYHDMFLGVYSNAVEAFLQTVTPLFETIMGVYLLFNEFPSDVRLPDSMKPELIIANDDLPHLFLSRPDELKRFFEGSNAQANNQFRDAISFVIVPNVAEFKRKRPPKRKQDSIMLDDPILESIRAAQDAVSADADTYGKSTYVDEMLPLMDWGAEYGFQVLFSPEERVRAGRAKREYLQNLNDAYAIDAVVERESGDCGILCLPDFTIMPPDGKLVTGKTAEGGIEVGVDVPELTVRSCYVAAGRLMANDVPDYLRRKLQRAKKDVTSMRSDLPGLGIDLSINPYLGETDLPTDHFLNDGLMSDLLSSNMPFLAFTHVSGRSPFLSVPRTLRRLHKEDGEQSYRHLHLFRQEIYLKRLLRAAWELGYGGSMPEDNEKAETMLTDHLNYILKWTKWYDPDKLVNSFPSALKTGQEFKVQRDGGNHFKIALYFEQGLIDEFGISF
jgi:hypothetical protein